jgi:hypothetical protein
MLLVTMCLFSGCIFGPAEPDPADLNNTSVINVGIVPIVSNGLHTTFTLEDAASAVRGAYQDPVQGNPKNLSFYYIRGENVDFSGNAERWIFGTREGNSSSMRVYDRTGVATIVWQGWLPEEEINITGILTPASIIKIAYPKNQSSPGNLEFEIINGEYTLTGPLGSHPLEHRINATTGVLITSHD